MSPDERVERALIVLLLQSMKTATLREKVQQLNLIGLANSEIAEYVGTSAAVVAQYLYASRQKAGKPRAKSAKKRATA